MIRADLLVKEKLNISRQKAQQLLQEGAVTIDGVKVVKASQVCDDNAEIKVDSDSNSLKYVSRGGLKLEGAIKAFNINFDNIKICIDIGASTGGFTDCMLQMGAECIYAVDVGTNQLDEKLKTDKRVKCFENTNILNFDCPVKADFVTADVSFVSITKILCTIKNMLNENGRAVVLIKPQFEAGRENLSKNGIVRNKAVHKRVLKNVISQAQLNELYCADLTVSPIKGGDGNIEYLLLLQQENCLLDIQKLIENAVKENSNVVK